MLGFNEKKVLGHLNLQMSINGRTLLVFEDLGFAVGADFHMFSGLSFVHAVELMMGVSLEYLLQMLPCTCSHRQMCNVS